MLKLIMTTILMTGIIFISMDIMKNYYKNKIQKTTINKCQDDPLPINDVFGQMFSEKSPWIQAINDEKTREVIEPNIRKTINF